MKLGGRDVSAVADDMSRVGSSETRNLGSGRPSLGSGPDGPSLADDLSSLPTQPTLIVIQPNSIDCGDGEDLPIRPSNLRSWTSKPPILATCPKLSETSRIDFRGQNCQSEPKPPDLRIRASGLQNRKSDLRNRPNPDRPFGRPFYTF